MAKTFAEHVKDIESERERNRTIEIAAYNFAVKLHNLVRKRDAGEKVEVKDLNDILRTLPVGQTYNIDSIASLPKRLLQIIPYLRDKGYRLDQPIFYNLLRDNHGALDSIFGPELYSPHPIMVRGIYTASVHRSDVYRKNIIILGDMHNPISNCPGATVISDYVDEILRENPKHVFDIFVEAAYHKEDDDRLPPDYAQGFLFGHVWDKFQDCLKASKESCPYKNLRMHYTDMRFYTAPSKDFNNISNYIQSLLNHAEENSRDDIAVKIRILKALKDGVSAFILTIKPGSAGSGYISKHDDIKNWVMRSYKIFRELKKCPYPIVKEFLTEYLESKIPQDGQLEMLISNIEDVLHMNGRPGYEREVIDILKNFAYTHFYVIEFTAAVMDVYLMARAFSKFNNTEERIAEPRNIIIMAGDNHCENYRQMLDEMFTFVNIGKTKLARTREEDKCIDMSQFPLSKLF